MNKTKKNSVTRTNGAAASRPTAKKPAAKASAVAASRVRAPKMTTKVTQKTPAKEEPERKTGRPKPLATKMGVSMDRKRLY